MQGLSPSHDERRAPRYRLPIAAGCAQFCGFVVLAVLWFTRGSWWAAPPPTLPGLFDYPSAYVGDSFLLPVAVALLVRGATLLPRARHDRTFATMFAVIAGALAAG